MNLKLKRTGYHTTLRALAVIALMIGGSTYLALYFSAISPAKAAISVHCHVTDGTFTICPDGSTEWSDVTPVFFPSSGSYLYADEAKLDPTKLASVDTLMLMYDDVARNVPLGPNEFVEVSFKTVEDVLSGSTFVHTLQHYSIHIFGDGSFIFLENGVARLGPNGELRVTELEDMRAGVGFGPSPNSGIPHVQAEFQIALTAAGGHSYSIDPLLWGSGFPSIPDLKCYVIHPNQSTPGGTGQKVSLSGQFGVEQDLTIGQAIELCANAEKTTLSPTNLARPGEPSSFHLDLKCYALSVSTPPATPKWDLGDQFGTEPGIAIGVPDRLCVWTIKNPTGTGQLPQFQIDFKCYTIQGISPGAVVNVSDQFENETNVKVQAPSHFCVPVTKTWTDSSGLTHISPPPDQLANLHYKCYTVPAGPTIGKSLDLLDQFGLEKGVIVDHAVRLCTNATKKLSTSPSWGPGPSNIASLNPFTAPSPPILKCYNIAAQPSTPVPIVDLEVRQFNDTETNVPVGIPTMLCGTTSKSALIGNKIVQAPAPLFNLELKCYSIPGTSPPNLVTLQDQFGTEPNLKVGNAYLLCVNVKKSFLSGAGIVTSVSGAPLDFKCYDLSINNPSPPTNVAYVNLTDQFHTENFVPVGAPFALCATATKQLPINPTIAATTPTVVPAFNLDYKCYRLPTSSPPLGLRVNLTDQFNPEINVPVGNPTALCEPAQKTVNPPPPPPPPIPPRLIGDFKCHNITEVTSNPPIPTLPAVNLQDQFGFEQGIHVLQPLMFCDTAIKTTSLGTFQPSFTGDLKCYSISGGVTPRATVDLLDQFGPERGLIVGPPTELCLAASKNGATFPPNFNVDFKCYRIFGRTANQIVGLQDEFLPPETGILVGKAFLVCSSVSKTAAPPPVQLDLKCYHIFGAPVAQQLQLQDQFTNETVKVNEPSALCTIAQKVPHLLPAPTDSNGNGVLDILDRCIFEPNQPDTNKTGFCNPLGMLATAAFIQAHDTGTTVTPVSLMGNQQPSLLAQLRMIIDGRCGTMNATCRTQWANDLVNGEVQNGVISQSDASSYKSALTQTTPTIPYIIPAAIAAAIILATIAFYKRKRLSALTSSFFASILASSRISRRRKHN